MDLRIEVVVNAAMRSAAKQASERERRRREAPMVAAELAALPDTEARRRIRASRGKLHSVPLVDLLIRKSAKTAPVDPCETLRLTGLVLALIDRMPIRVLDQHPPKLWLDLRGAAWAEQGNALRMLRQWKRARQCFGRATILLEGGTGDLSRAARVASLMGSHYWDRGKLRAAATALRIAANSYADLGEEQQLGKVQIQQAALLDYRGFLPKAVEVQIEAIGRLDEQADPMDFLTAHGNLASMMERLGQASAALSVLEYSRPWLEDLPETRNVAVWYWISGRCRMSISSDAGEAEADLLHSWRIMEQLERWSDVGLVGLDLSELYLNHGRFEELEKILEPTAAALSRQKLTPDGVRMLQAYRRAIGSVSAHVENLRGVIAKLANLVRRRDGRA